MAQKSYSESYNVFHGMLKLALKDCPKIYPEIEKTELFEKKLIACILKFYECTGETYWTRNANLKKRKKTIFEFGTWGGVNFKPVSSNFKSPTSTPLPGMAFGVINRVFLPKNGYRYSFDFGVSFYQRSLRYSLNAEVIKTTQVYAPIRFTQHFSSRKFHSFASIGVELGKPRDNIDTFPFTAGGGCELKLGKKFKIALIGNFRILKISQADIGLVLFFT